MTQPNWTDREIRAKDQDTLRFQQYCQVLTAIIGQADTPLTVGIFGPWGSGKTSLMRLIEEALQQQAQAPVTVWFNAWKYDQEEALWRALVIQVLNAFRPPAKEPAEGLPSSSESYLQELAQRKKAREALNQRLDDLEASLYRTVEREEVGGVTLDWDKLLKGSVMGITHLSLSALPGVGSVLGKMMEEAQKQITGQDLTTIFEAIQRERRKVYRQHIQSLEQFQQKFEQLVKTEALDKNRRLLVFIDDLDRCLPEKAIEVLEALKLFIDVPGCIFFLGADREVIQKGIRVKYQGFLVDSDDPAAADRRIPISGDNYLEKIVQLPFHLLPLDEERVKEFIEKSGVELPPGCADIFAAGLEANPRKVKRTLNIFRLLHQLARMRQDEFRVEGQPVEIKPQLLAKVVVIQSRYRELYTDLVEFPILVQDLERLFVSGQKPGLSVAPPAGEQPPETFNQAGESQDVVLNLEPAVAAEQPAPTLLEKYQNLRPLQRLLRAGEACFANLPLAEVKLYLYLTYTTDESQAKAVETGNIDRWWAQLLSHDSTKINNALSEIRAEAPGEWEGVVKRLEGLVQQATEPGQRPAANLALAYMFDELISIAAGQYPVGSRGGKQFIEGFKIGRYPVSNAGYKLFLKENPKQEPPQGWQDGWYPPGEGSRPVTGVSRQDAQAFCGWAGKRLPKAHEWQAASEEFEVSTISEWTQTGSGNGYTYKILPTEESLPLTEKNDRLGFRVAE